MALQLWQPEARSSITTYTPPYCLSELLKDTENKLLKQFKIYMYVHTGKPETDGLSRGIGDAPESRQRTMNSDSQEAHK